VGFKTVAEALYLRDHLLEQPELAGATDDPAMRRARCTFVVVVGAGYNRDRARGAGAAVHPGRAPSLPAYREHRQFVRLRLVSHPEARLKVAEPLDLYRSDGGQLDDRTHVDAVATGSSNR
jgi:hypothetical protein